MEVFYERKVLVGSVVWTPRQRKIKQNAWVCNEKRRVGDSDRVCHTIDPSSITFNSFALYVTFNSSWKSTEISCDVDQVIQLALDQVYFVTMHYLKNHFIGHLHLNYYITFE